MAEKFAEVLARDIAEELGFRWQAVGVPVSTVSAATGFVGAPLVSVGDGVSTHQNVLIRIVPEATLQIDGIGNTQRVYAPFIVQVVMEQQFNAATSPAAITGVSVLTIDNQLRLWECLIKHGTKIELYMNATGGAAPAETDIAAANLVSVQYPALYFPLTSQS